ncbi:MAG: hypothetical protein PHI35_03355 [Victivallaceae bacterium]|nr:hypothetical protein [Victivallaceae bacterium]
MIYGENGGTEVDERFYENFREKMHKFAVTRIWGGPFLIFVGLAAGLLQFFILKGLCLRAARTLDGGGENYSWYVLGFIILEFLLYPLATHVTEAHAWDIGDNSQYTGSGNYAMQSFILDITIINIVFSMGPRPFWLGIFHLADGLRLLIAMPPRLRQTAACFAAHRDALSIDDAAAKLGYDPTPWIKHLDQAGALVYLPSRKAWKLTDRFMA